MSRKGLTRRGLAGAILAAAPVASMAVWWAVGDAARFDAARAT